MKLINQLPSSDKVEALGHFIVMLFVAGIGNDHLSGMSSKIAYCFVFLSEGSKVKRVAVLRSYVNTN